VYLFLAKQKAATIVMKQYVYFCLQRDQPLVPVLKYIIPVPAVQSILMLSPHIVLPSTKVSLGFQKKTFFLILLKATCTDFFIFGDFIVMLITENKINV